MNVRARAWSRRHAALLAAVLLHIGLLWLIVPYMANSEPPPADPVEVAMVLPAPPPKHVRPKPVPKPAVRPAEKNETAGRPHFQPAPRLPRMVQPPLHLDIPPPLLPKPPMTLPAASAASPSGPPGNGQGGSGNGPGYGSQEGNDYLVRLKAYIDAHKGSDRLWGPNDADLILVLDPDGVLLDIHVTSSSGDPAVDDQIVVKLKGMSPFPKPPAILFDPLHQRLAVADRWIFPRS